MIDHGGAGGLQQTFVDANMAVPLPARVWRHGGAPKQVNKGLLQTTSANLE